MNEIERIIRLRRMGMETASATVLGCSAGALCSAMNWMPAVWFLAGFCPLTFAASVACSLKLKRALKRLADRLAGNK